MKTTALFLLTLLPALTFGQFSQPTVDVLTAEVHGDTVILRDDSANRNCGAQYTMQITNINSYSFRWVQKDFGGIAYCYCFFNLSVTVDSLKPGDYSVDTYYTHPDNNMLIYIGTISFTILNPNSYLSPSIVDQEQSPCFIVGISTDNGPIGPALKVYPNPAKGYLNISTDLPGDKTIILSDLIGNILLQLTSDKNEITIDLMDLPAQMVLVTVKNNMKAMHAKVFKN